MISGSLSRLFLGLATVTLVGCASVSRGPSPEPPLTRPQPGEQPPAPGAPPVAAPGAPGAPPRPAQPARLPEKFESSDFIVTVARAGDTAGSLAARHLGDPAKAWMILDFMGVSAITEGQEVVIPRREWNPPGIFPWGYTVVPVLVYHNIGPEPKGRLLIAAKTFEEQMRHLKAEGFHALTLEDFLQFIGGRRQLPRKSVLIAFDDGYRSFLRHARPILKELGFPATLFVYTDFIGSGGNALSWQDLRTLAEEGFDIQAHSKTHGDLRRRLGESDAQYVKRMEAELALPQALFRKHLGRPREAIAYPYGAADEEVTQRTAEHGYRVAFTVRRQSNPAFVVPFRIGRAQVYAEMSLREFARNLMVVHDEPIAGAVAEGGGRALAKGTVTGGTATTVQALARGHLERAEAFEARGQLRQALEAHKVALTIDPGNASIQTAVARLNGEILRRARALTDEGHRLLQRGSHAEARRHFLGALALDPQNRGAFEALQREIRDITFIVHTVRSGETLASIAELYYGDQLRAEVIAETNRLGMNARLAAGGTLRIPEIPGVPFLPR